MTPNNIRSLSLLQAELNCVVDESSNLAGIYGASPPGHLVEIRNKQRNPRNLIYCIYVARTSMEDAPMSIEPEVVLALLSILHTV